MSGTLIYCTSINDHRDMKYFVIGAVVLAVIAGVIYFLSRPSLEETGGTPQATVSEQQVSPVIVGNELKIADLKVGEGAEARSGTTVSVHYVGTFANGVKFDSSYDRGQPFVFTLGQGTVIPGWERGVPGMRVGGRRRLMIPPALAYGQAGSPGVIPSNTALIFEVDLIAVQ